MRNLTEHEKAQIAKAVGSDLVQHYGKKKYYSQKQVKRAVERKGYEPDIACWVYCLYLDHASFDAYHRSIGETCDFTAMKESMVSALTDHKSDSWFDFDWDLSWLELPDIDVSDLFGFIDL